jgi:hypothetical protein
MTARIVGLVGLVAGLVAAAAGPDAFAQQPEVKRPKWVYAHDLRVRSGGKVDFGPDTPKVGVEFFQDGSTGGLVALSQSGSIAVIPAGSVGSDKKATWLFAHDLRSRKGDEEKFTPTTAKYGVEVFKDTGSGKLLYVSEKLAIALADEPGKVATDKNPAWHHALILKVRGPSEKDFGAGTKKYGVEAFKDGNTGGLIYISETGAIATAPAPAQPPAPDGVKAPKALYGLTLRVRKAGEDNFNDKTQKYGVEVFQDENTGGLIYISETGSIATAPSVGAVTAGQGVDWKHAMTLKAREGGINEFAKAKSYGVEVFQDKNTGHMLYVTETGAIAVLPKK